MFEVRTIRYGIKDEERAIDDARRAAVKNARRQAEVYADAAGVKLAEILEIFDGVAQNLGSEASLRAATPNVQVSPPATIPFRAGDQHQMADRLAALKAHRNIVTHPPGSDIVTRFESHAPWHDVGAFN